jgi:hypothetical protein
MKSSRSPVDMPMTASARPSAIPDWRSNWPMASSLMRSTCSRRPMAAETISAAWRQDRSAGGQ